MTRPKLIFIALLGLFAALCLHTAFQLQVTAPWATVLMVGDFGISVLGIVAIAI